MLSKLGTFLKKNALTIVLAILPPIVIWFALQKESSDLSITVTSKTSVVSLDSKFSDGIEVFHNKKSIKALYVSDIRFKNEGNRAIEKADFDQPLKVTFNGEVIAPIKVINTEPAGLPVHAIASTNTVEISPLLLNPDDTFSIQVKVVNPTDNELTIEPFARIKALKKISFNPYSDSKDNWPEFFLGVAASILGAISVVSGTVLFRRLRIVSISLPGVTLELARELEADKEIGKRVVNLADQLNISGHDFKSNILLLRLKIESQLRDLARKSDLNIRKLGSVNMLSKSLANAGIINNKVVALIHDISPAMNRELHESDSYLTNTEFETLQQAALSVIAALEENLDDNTTPDTQQR